MPPDCSILMASASDDRFGIGGSFTPSSEGDWPFEAETGGSSGKAELFRDLGFLSSQPYSVSPRYIAEVWCLGGWERRLFEGKQGKHGHGQVGAKPIEQPHLDIW